MAKAEMINHTNYHISPSPNLAYCRYLVWKAFQINLQQKIIYVAILSRLNHIITALFKCRLILLGNSEVLVASGCQRSSLFLGCRRPATGLCLCVTSGGGTGVAGGSCPPPPMFFVFVFVWLVSPAGRSWAW